MKILTGCVIANIGAVLLAVAWAQPRGAWVESRGARVQIPDGWSANQNLLAFGGPVGLTNFGGTYWRGGILPPGGAEIDITRVSAPPNLPDFIRKELQGTRLGSLQAFSDGGKTGIEVAYTYRIARGATLRNAAVYVPHGPNLYKFYLSWWAGDRNEPVLLDSFRKVISGAELR